MKNLLEFLTVMVGIFVFVWIVALFNNSKKEDVSDYYYRTRSNIMSTAKSYSTQPASIDYDDHDVTINTTDNDVSEKTYDTDSMMADPADYDSPEDFADDVWGEDFDDWDEAYEYWEDNE